MASNPVIPAIRPDGMPEIIKSMAPGESRTFPIARRNAAWIAANRLGIEVVTRRNKTNTKFTLWRMA